MDQFYDDIIKELNAGVSRKDVYCHLLKKGYMGKHSAAYDYMNIEKYKLSEIQELSRFAEGLEKDIEAVENSVASPLSNGFVEGTNNKLKMVKRTMYDRCSRQLLEAKLMYRPNV